MTRSWSLSQRQTKTAERSTRIRIQHTGLQREATGVEADSPEGEEAMSDVTSQGEVAGTCWCW